MFRAATVAFVLLGTSAALAQSNDASSQAWNSRRVDLWVELCPATAPAFSGFERAALRAGFTQNAEGSFRLADTEIVASIGGSPCRCLMTFRSDDGRLALELLQQAMSRKFADRFAPGQDTPGVLQTQSGEVQIQTMERQIDGGNWVGLVAEGAPSCP